MAGNRPPLPYSKALLARRKAGERIGLLVVALHDWEAGENIASREHTARVVVPDDKLPHDLDWSACVALDCLLCGPCPEPVFYAAATMLYAAGAASIWGEFEDGIWRLEHWARMPFGFYAEGGPVTHARLGWALSLYRDWALMARCGAYGTAIYAQARLETFRKVFGAKAQRAQDFVDRVGEYARAA